MSVSKIGTYVFYQHPNLETVETGATLLEAYAFNSATKLETVDLTSSSAVTISANAFNGSTSLDALLIRSTARSALSNTSALIGTKIVRGIGGIYVPADLLSSYKSATNWTSFQNNIYPLTAYPVTDFSTISDSWETIIANSNYATDYAVGDTKNIVLTDGTELYMQLVGINLDDKADNSGKARMTWVSKEIYTTHRMNATATTSGGWAESEMRSWLISDVLPLFPSDIQAMMKPVNKTYRTKSPNDETLSIADTIWIPSYKEMGLGTAAYVESDGVVYSGVFSSSANRIKYNASGTAARWWLRSVYNAAYFGGVSSGGSANDYSASGASGVVLGFCI